MKTWKISLLLSYISVASASAAIITPALPVIQNTLNLSSGQLNWIISLFLIGYMIGQILYAPVANRFGRLNALRFGFALNIIGILICLIAGYLQNYSLLLTGRIVTALGASAGLSCTFMLLNESLTQERAKHALSFAILSFTVGIGLAVLVGGIITHNLSWVDCFWVLLLHGIAMLISTYCFEETLKKRIAINFKTIASNYKKAFSSKTLFVFSLCMGSVTLFSYCYSAAAPIITYHLFNLSAEQYGYWNIINMVGMCLGSLYAARVLKKYSNKTSLLGAMILSIILLLVMASMVKWQLLSVIGFFILSALIYFVASIIFPAASHIASNAIEDKASASSSMNFINMASAVLGVAIMGYLPLAHIWAMLWTMAVFFILCLVLWSASRA